MSDKIANSSEANLDSHGSGETTAYAITLKYTGEVTEIITAKSLEEAVEYLKKKHLPEDRHGDKSDWPDFMRCDFGSEIYKPEKSETIQSPASGASLPPRTGSAIPRALFSCSNKYCREEVSYHADQLYWYAQEKRWVCENCWDNLPDPTDEEGRPTRGVTLAEHIIGGDFKAVALLQNDQAQRRAPETGVAGKETQ